MFLKVWYINIFTIRVPKGWSNEKMFTRTKKVTSALCYSKTKTEGDGNNVGVAIVAFCDTQKKKDLLQQRWQQ
jgi:hypothetical protein